MKLRDEINKMHDKACDKIYSVANKRGDAILWGGLGVITGTLFGTAPHEFGHAAPDYFYSGKFPSFGFDSDGNPVTHTISTVDSVGNSGMAVIDAGGSAANYIAGTLLAAASEKIKNPYKKLFVKGAALANIIHPIMYSVANY